MFFALPLSSLLRIGASSDEFPVPAFLLFLLGVRSGAVHLFYLHSSSDIICVIPKQTM